ncbi:MAG: serine/threonine-protein kinase [Pyrinomonadaceae bacterium]
MLDSDTLLQNRYLVVRPIGKGGMGAVYLAKDQRLRSTVALKETFFEDEAMLKAFEREAALLANLRHPALPRVIDHFTEDKGQFLVMEFIPGDDLEEMLKAKGGAFSPTEVLGWADQLLDALDYLHTQEPQIIHRDIKPQNMKLTARGQIILLDFGLAKGTAGEMSKVAGTGSIMGYTPTYAPLEQIHSTGTDPRSDLYSLAATFYHLITGVTPPDALFRASAVIGGQADPLRPAHEINPQVSPAVSAVLTRAMSLHSEQRPANAAEMRRELAQARLAPVAAISGSISSPDSATVVVSSTDAPPASIKQATQVQESAVTVIEPPPQSSISKETHGDSGGRKTQPVVAAAVQPAVTDQPGRRTNRMPMIIGGIALLLVAGIAIAFVASNNSGTSDSVSNKPATANAQATGNAGGQAKQEAAPQGNSEKGASGSSSGASQATKTPATQDKKPEAARPTVKSTPTPVKDAVRDRLKKRAGAY